MNIQKINSALDELREKLDSPLPRQSVSVTGRLLTEEEVYKGIEKEINELVWKILEELPESDTKEDAAVLINTLIKASMPPIGILEILKDLIDNWESYSPEVLKSFIRIEKSS